MKNTTINILIAASLGSLSFSGIAANVNANNTPHNNQLTKKFAVQDSFIQASPDQATIKNVLAKQAQFSLVGNESFIVKDHWIDKLGKRHQRLTQKINGLPVFGTSITIHSTLANKGIVSTDAQSKVYKVSGKLATIEQNTLNSQSTDKSESNTNQNTLDKVEVLARELGTILGDIEQVYIYLPLSNETKLSWKVEVTWDNGGEDFGRDYLFYDVHSANLLTRHPQVHSAKNWKTHTLQNQGQAFAPGQLLCTNNQNCGDASAQRAHDGAATVYDYYLSRFNRDSINGSGLTMVSSVHLGNNVANAYWTGSQMLYGDGDGQQLADLTLSFDVIGHELTHGVTQYTAGLIYANASGALNEAWSDILGVASKAYRDNTTTADWKLAEESYTPGVSGDAMRYMDNPTKDNYSKDWWPERIPYVNNPSNSNDQGGVHGNSGIANLAFALLTDGGSHPRGKSSAQVSGVGLLKSEQIFYRALTTYMNQNTNFAGARTATAQAALDLYGNSAKTSVETAWCAVGVGSCPTSGGTQTQALENNVAITGITGAEKAELFYTLDVPNGATDLVFTTTGGSGDADLFVRFENAPTLNTYDCKSTTATSNETCAITNIQTGTYHIMVQAWNQISGVSLTGKYTAPSTGGGLKPISAKVDNVSVTKNQWTRYTYDLPAGYSDLIIAMSGGTGDADLYINHGAQSSNNVYQCRPYEDGNNESCTINTPAAGVWYIDIFGYTSASGINLTLKATP